MFNIQWIILSTNSAESCIISKTDIFDPSLPVLILGHDVQRIHYVSLERRADMEDIYLNVRGMNSCVKLRSVYGDGENSTTSPTSTITVQPKCSDFDIPPKVVSYPVGLPTNALQDRITVVNFRIYQKAVVKTIPLPSQSSRNVL